MTAPKVGSMDESYGSCYRITGVDDTTQALTLAAETWTNENPGLGDECPSFAVESHGWYRCIPCICGDGHQYDVWPAEPHARGATYTYLIGYAPPARQAVS